MTDDVERERAIEAYCDAYEHANGYRPSRVRYERGWYRLPMNQSVRHVDMEEYTARLLARPARSASISKGTAND